MMAGYEPKPWYKVPWKVAVAALCVAAAAWCCVRIAQSASFQRGVKTIASNMGDGIDRELVVYDAVGDVIYRDSGRFDIDYTGDRVLYDDEEGLRHVVYLGGGTVVVNETGGDGR